MQTGGVVRDIVLKRSACRSNVAFICGNAFAGEVSVVELRTMASPEWAAECTRIADEIEGPARAALREATRDSERVLARAEPCPPTCRSVAPQKQGES